jgi:bifunctional non-homologous end joining protein LigD
MGDDWTLRRNVPALDSAGASVYLPRLMSGFSEQRRLQGAIPLHPCLPRRAITPPTGDGWVHEIKHDGFRIVARREGNRIRLFTRNGYDFTARFPKIAAAVADLPVRSCVVDGEAIVVNREGLSVFDLLRYRHHDHAAVLCAFDLIELDGFDLRQQPLERRKDTLAYLLRDGGDGIALNSHFVGDGVAIFKHACVLGCEGIVSKLLGSPYRSGRVDHWLKVKNPSAPAARREGEEDWGNRRATRGGSRHRRHPLRYDLTEVAE